VWGGSQCSWGSKDLIPQAIDQVLRRKKHKLEFEAADIKFVTAKASPQSLNNWKKWDLSQTALKDFKERIPPRIKEIITLFKNSWFALKVKTRAAVAAKSKLGTEKTTDC
jgi:hypothetical protein